MIQGTVRRTAGGLRVTVEVSNARGFVVWSDRFDTPDEELVALEEKIAATVLNRIRPDSSRMRAREIRPSPEALDAMGDIVRGRQLLELQTPESLRQAITMFERVAATAPDYARSHSGIADGVCDMFRLGLILHPEARSRAHEAVRQALRIDPSSFEAHASAATIARMDRFRRGQGGSLVHDIARTRRDPPAPSVSSASSTTMRERHDENQGHVPAGARP